ASPSQAINAMVGGNTIWIKKAASSYTIGSTLIPKLGSSGSPTMIKGYNATRGDLDDATSFDNHPVLLWNGGASGILLTLSGTLSWLFNLVLDADGASSSRCVSVTAANAWIVNCLARNFTSYGFLLGAQAQVLRCLATGGTSAATAAFSNTVNSVLFDS